MAQIEATCQESFQGTRMARVAGLECLRCKHMLDALAFNSDCPNCRSDTPSNLVVAYQKDEEAFRARPRPSGGVLGLWRYGNILPVSREEAVSLGEGGTALHLLASLGSALGLRALLGKDETRNPTGSFKDRLACIAVSTAKKLGSFRGGIKLYRECRRLRRCLCGQGGHSLCRIFCRRRRSIAGTNARFWCHGRFACSQGPAVAIDAPRR